MEWNNYLTLDLIKEYKKKTMLWNPKDPNYYNKYFKSEAWEEIARELNTTSEECRKKMQSLHASLRREKGKIVNSIKADTGWTYKSSWFAFNSMSFLLDRRKQRGTESGTLNQDAPESITIDENTCIKLEPEEIGLSTDSILEAPKESSYHNEDDSVPQKRKNDNENEAFKLPKKKIKSKNENARLKDSFLMSRQSLINAVNDECQSFGKYITDKLRSYPTRTRCAVQHAISNIIFSADQGNLANYQPYGQENDFKSQDVSAPSETVLTSTEQLPESETHAQQFLSSPAPSADSHGSINSLDAYDSEMDFTDLG